MDIMCLSDAYLDSSVPIDDDNLQIPWYNSFKADHPSNTKGGGVLTYYQIFLPIKIIDVKYLQQIYKF